MVDMKKHTRIFPRVGLSPRWGTAFALVIVAASTSAAMAQSTLRFLDASSDATMIGPVESSSAAIALQPNMTELRFVDGNPNMLASNSPVQREAAPSEVAPAARVDVASTLTIAPTQRQAPNPAQANQVSAWELKFEPLPQQVGPQPAAPARFAAPRFAPAASELFTPMPELESRALSQPVAIQSVPTSTPTTANFAPVGTELFSTVAPKRWDLPALDYGLALKQIEPPSPVVVKAHPVEPTRVVIKPIEASPGSELFAAGPPRQPQPSQAAELDFSNVQVPASPPKPVFVAAPSTRSAPPASVAAPIERFVPAAAMPLVAAKQPFPLESNNVAPAPSAKPALVAAATPAPTASSAFTSTEPAFLDTYKFRFAATTDIAPETSVAGTPAAFATLSNQSEALLPADTSVPHQYDVPSAQCDCPYGCAQSGTQVICGVDCGQGGAPCCSTWSDSKCIPWSLFGPGEYVGPARTEHVSTYFLRVNDFLTLTFIESRKKSAEHYRIGVGDQLQIEWLQGAANTETPLNRTLLVQPDGTVTLPLIGEVAASGKTIPDFHDEVVKLYGKFQREPEITVTPISVNVGIQDLLKAVTSKSSSSGQTQDLRVTPEGTIQAAGIGSVYVQGLTLDELRSELEARYAAAYGPGLSVSPALTDRATSYVFLGGEVKAPGRYTLEGPTTVMQAIALAGGWNIGGNVRQVVIFRRDENWCLKATKIDVRAPLYGQDPCPVNDVWLRENDLVIVPKSKILCATDVINLYFTRGVYAVFPINYVYDFSQSSGIVPIP
jgi:polysaccharide export outer membrane protein